MRLMESANSCRSAGSTLLLLPQMRRLCQSPVGDCVARAMFFTGWLGNVARVCRCSVEDESICLSKGCLPCQVNVAIRNYSSFFQGYFRRLAERWVMVLYIPLSLQQTL